MRIVGRAWKQSVPSLAVPVIQQVAPKPAMNTGVYQDDADSAAPAVGRLSPPGNSRRAVGTGPRPPAGSLRSQAGLRALPRSGQRRKWGSSPGADGRATAVYGLGSALLMCLLVLAGCGGSPAPTRLELVDLARFTDQYDGERVSTTGHVRSHPDPEHYWLEDEDLNRVAVQPDSAVKALVGERVRVVGRFRYSRDKGRAIEADEVEVLQ